MSAASAASAASTFAAVADVAADVSSDVSPAALNRGPFELHARKCTESY